MKILKLMQLWQCMYILEHLQFVLCGIGTSIAGCNRFRIVVKGAGCHGAMPETGVDPINIAAHIYLALQEIITREIPATKPAVITIGKFVGGETPNIIPGEVSYGRYNK